MKSKVSLVMITLLFLTSCARIVSKSQYPVSIMSNPDQAEITVIDDKGEMIYKGKTPTTLTLTAGGPYLHGHSYTITFQKEGYEPQTATLQKELDAWYLGNILVGGLIGMLIVDPLTGAMWKLPPEISVNLAGKTTSRNNDKNALQVVLLDDIPEDLRMKLIKLQ